MTAHRCCPECGAELTADGGKFCGCVGPFTAEHVDPMHIRPYVDLPETADRGTRAPDLEPFARCGRDETAELPALSPHEGREAPAGREGGEPGGPGRAAPGVSGGRDGHGDYDGYDGYEEYDGYEVQAGAGTRALSPSAPRGGAHRRKRGSAPYGRNDGSERRRRPSKAVFAAAGVVAALGAGLLTAQTLTDEGSADDRSLSTDDTALPDVPSGGPTTDPSRTDDGDDAKKPSAKRTSRTGGSDSRAARDGEEHTGRAPAPRTSASSAPGGSGSDGSEGRDHDHDGGWGGGSPDRDRPRPPQDPSSPDEETLRAGDTGPQVVELQRRLKQAGTLDEDAAEDGVYSAEVQQAVAQYQARNGIRGDRYGEYGANTRRALEAQTSG
ncbi:putative peptidoglycan binding protein [Streptomyces sp. Amel2xB2]|nr:putative peptidoglycan binding protein [Streptomyces sp. Amel2xB2]